MLLRLKEFETLKEISGKIGEVKVVVGAESIAALLPSELIGLKANATS